MLIIYTVYLVNTSTILGTHYLNNKTVSAYDDEDGDGMGVLYTLLVHQNLCQRLGINVSHVIKCHKKIEGPWREI